MCYPQHYLLSSGIAQGFSELRKAQAWNQCGANSDFWQKKKVILITISHSGFLFRSINTQKEKHLSVSVGLCTYSFCLKLKRDAEELKIYNLLTYSSKKIWDLFSIFSGLFLVSFLSYSLCINFSESLPGFEVNYTREKFHIWHATDFLGKALVMSWDLFRVMGES